MLAIDINCAIIMCANKRRSAVNLIFANWGEKTVATRVVVIAIIYIANGAR